MAITKLLMSKGGNPEKAILLVVAATGVATVGISSITIHSGLGINLGVNDPLNDQPRTSLRNRLSEIRFSIIDEIL